MKSKFEDLQRSDYVEGGYFVTRLVERPKYVSPELMPDSLFSASACICDFLPDTWAIEWGSVSVKDREQIASKLGLRANDLQRIVRWATTQFEVEFGWPRVCYSLETVVNLSRDFLTGQTDVVVFGLSLHHGYTDAFLEYAKPPERQRGYSPVGETGLFHVVSKRNPIPQGGEILGFEPLSYDYDLSCSWLCNGLEKDCSERLGISPNDHGFLGSFDEASKCVEYISQDDVGAEPGMWLPWLVVRYI